MVFSLQITVFNFKIILHNRLLNMLTKNSVLLSLNLQYKKIIAIICLSSVMKFDNFYYEILSSQYLKWFYKLIESSYWVVLNVAIILIRIFGLLSLSSLLYS